MALSGKVEGVVEIKSSADKFYNIISSQTHHIPNASSDKVHEIEVHEGDWETTGSVKLWKYTVEGNVETFKEKIDVDEENKVVTLTAVEGHLLNDYKSYKNTMQVTPKSEGATVKITLDYEKINENVPPPNKYLNFAIDVVKDIDAHLLKA